MAAITWPNVEAHDASLSVVTTEAQNDILAFVNAKVNVACFDGEEGPQSKLARIMLAAHFGVVSQGQGQGAAGPIVKDKAGDLETQYANLLGGGAFDPMTTTSYGQTFVLLSKHSSCRAPFIV